MKTPEELRELDALIHVNLFDGDKFVGLKKRGFWYRHDASGYTDKQEEAGKFTMQEAKKHEYLKGERVTIHPFTAPPYTTDYAAALMALEKGMKDKINAGDISFCSTENGYFWFRTVKGNRHVDGEAPTITLAICLFLKELFSK